MTEKEAENDLTLEQVVTEPENEHYSDLDDNTKMELIAKHFPYIMQVLGMDLEDDSLKDTPKRVAKMYVKEIFSGLNPANKPNPTLFKNQFQYKQMLVERNIAVLSNCEHHFVPILGKAHVAYISNGQVISHVNSQ